MICTTSAKFVPSYTKPINPAFLHPLGEYNEGILVCQLKPQYKS